MTLGNHPLCQKPDDCRCFRAGEQLCLECKRPRKPEMKSKLYVKARRMFGPTRAKRIVLEDQMG